MDLPIPLLAPTLTGSLVTLKQLDELVLQDYLNLLEDENVVRWTGTAEPFTFDQINDWLKTRATKDDRLDWAIFEKNSNCFVGELVLNEPDATNKSLNLRIAINSKFQNLGFGTEATKLACDFCLNILGVNYVTLQVMESNFRAQRTYEKVGFKKESGYTEDGVSYIEMKLWRGNFLK